MARGGINRSTRLQKGLTFLLLLAFLGGGGYLYLLGRSVRSDQARIQYEDTHAMQTPEMIEYTKKTDTDRALIQALRKDDAEEVARFLEQGATGSTRVAGRPLAMRAANRGTANILALLIARGVVDFNVRDDQDRTLLMEAMKSGKPAIVEMVLKHGGDVNAIDNKGRTALMYAANAWVLDDPVTWTVSGRVFTSAVKIEEPRPWDVETTRQMLLPLLEKGARIEVKDNRGTTAMQYAACGDGQPAMVELLLERGAVPDDALMGVAGSGNAALLQKLIDKGANVNQKYPGDYPTALAYAKSMAKGGTRENYQRVVQILLKAGAKE